MMELTKQIAKNFREVHYGKNWTDVNLKNTLEGITWEQAVTKIYNLNTIASLVFHINYYVSHVLKVLQGEPLTAKDQYSFDSPPVNSEEDWSKLKQKVFSDADEFAAAIERLDDKRLFEVFSDPKYGDYYRNLHGIIEHTHYHLGQIMLLKKITTAKEKD